MQTHCAWQMGNLSKLLSAATKSEMCVWWEPGLDINSECQEPVEDLRDDPMTHGQAHCQYASTSSPQPANHTIGKFGGALPSLLISKNWL